MSVISVIINFLKIGQNFESLFLMWIDPVNWNSILVNNCQLQWMAGNYYWCKLQHAIDGAFDESNNLQLLVVAMIGSDSWWMLQPLVVTNDSN